MAPSSIRLCWSSDHCLNSFPSNNSFWTFRTFVRDDRDRSWPRTIEFSMLGKLLDRLYLGVPLCVSHGPTNWTHPKCDEPTIGKMGVGCQAEAPRRGVTRSSTGNFGKISPGPC